MKMKYRVALLCCAGISCFGQAQTSQVHIAGNNYPVQFEDTTLSVTNRQRIASDLTTVFSLATSFDELKGEEIKTDIFPLGRDLMFMSREGDNIFIVATNSTTSVKVNKVVSDKYLKAFTWMDANTNIVQKAHEFVTLLNNPDLLLKPSQVLIDLGHTMPLSLIVENDPANETKMRNYLTENVCPYKYPGVSALNFYRKPVSVLDFAEIPLLFLWVIDKSDPTEVTAFPIGFYKGKWGFGNFPDPD